MSSNQNSMIVDASPTKEFFIDILIRDINLIDSVKDLIDNSVDGARKLRGNNSLNGLSVQVSLDPSHFLIVDNCGGISVSVAREYAFRFGRPSTVTAPPGTIGKFGVGMKRALFKIGNVIKIQSVSADSRFTLIWNVDDWKRLVDEKGKDLWELEFTDVVEGENNPPEICGTTLEVTSLHPNIATEFGTQQFAYRLMTEIESAHETSMEAGLEVEVNDVEIRHKLATLYASGELVPAKIIRIFPANPERGPSPEDVRLTIYVGIAESSFSSSGWYIVCNGRQVLKADKSKVTGWESIVDGVKNPRAHNQFSRFRGHAFFESADASNLPWNTAKSGLEVESPVYQWALSLMTAAMRQVIDFLNELDAELDTESGFLQSVIDRARPARLTSITASEKFSYPDRTTTSEAPKLGRVSFQYDKEGITFLKSFFSVSSAESAGSRSFDYVLEREREQ